MSTANPLNATPVPAPAPDPARPAGRLTPVDPVRILRAYAWLWVITLVVGVAAGVGVWWVLKEFSPEYTAEAQLQVTDGVTNAYEAPRDVGSLDGSRLDLLRAYIQNQAELIRSEEVLRDAIRHPDVQRTLWYNSFDGPSEAQAALRRNLSAGQMAGTTLIGVNFTVQGQDNQDQADSILNAVMETYTTNLRLQNEMQSDQVRRTFVREVESAEEEMRQIEERLRQFRVTNDLPSLDSRANEATIAYARLADEKARLEVAYEQAQNNYQALQQAQAQGKLTAGPEEMARVYADPAISSRDERLRALREERDVALRRFGPQHRYVEQIDAQIEATELERQREVDRLLRERQQVQIAEAANRAGSLESQLAGLEPKLAESRGQVRRINNLLEEYRTIGSRREAASNRLAKAEDLLNSVRITNRRPDASRVHVRANAVGASMTFPQFTSVVFGVTLIFMLTVAGLVFLKEMLDQRIKSPADLRLMPDAQVLGVLPAAGDDPSGEQRFEGVVQRDPSGLLAESFRQVRTGLLNRIERRGYRTVMIVGAQGASGVSTIVQNLAMSLANNGRRVLVVDANFRRPAQHRLFGAEAAPGLVEVLRENLPIEQVIQPHGDPAVDLLPAGDTHHAVPEVLESSAFRNMVARLESQYDVILFDVPPALVSIEAQALSKRLDAVAVVVRAMSEKRGMIGRVLRQFSHQRAEMMGVILNDVRTSAGGYFRESYERFYEYNQNGHANGNGQARSANGPPVRRRGGATTGAKN